MLNYYPKYFTTKAIGLYILLLFLNTVIFRQVLPLLWVIFGLLEVTLFFTFSGLLTKAWATTSTQHFPLKLFRIALTVRLIYVVLVYYFYEFKYEMPFEFDAGDSVGYHNEAIWISDLIKIKDLDLYFVYKGSNYSDMGYPLYLGVLYSIFGKSIIFIRLLKSLLGALTCVFVYKLAKRNFGEPTGKIAGTLAMVSPNLIYYCGLHLKESEMIFLTVLLLERTDFLLHTKNIKLTGLILILLVGLSLFFLRTVLGIATSFAIATSVIFSPTVLVKLNRKLIFFLWGGLVLLATLGGTLEKNVTKYLEESSENQAKGMISRTNRVGGNKLAKHGSTVLFAPVILIAPFPTLVNIETQQNQMMLNGGYYIKNIIGFFVLLALFMLYKKKEIRNHTLLLSFVFSYLAIIAMSTFALSERFHLPALPFLLILAAYGITKVTNQSKKYFLFYLIIVSVLIIGWNWFKITGRA